MNTSLIERVYDMGAARSTRLITPSFLLTHPFRIDYPDGTHTRYTNLLTAARTGVEARQGVWDEGEQKGWTVEECRKIVDGQRRY